MEGDPSKKYSLLWSYSVDLRRASSENTCNLELETISPNLEPRFGSKRAIRNACGPCHLKHKYVGKLVIAVGRDPNDQYLTLAFVVVEVENTDS